MVETDQLDAKGVKTARPKAVEPANKHAPTLQAIIAFKLLKGSVFVAVACIAYALSNNDLPSELRQWLSFLRANPERVFWHDLAIQVGKLTETKMLWAALGTLVYSLFSLVEGVGLIFRVSWAGWLAIGESAFFIPIEVTDLIHHYSHLVFGILVVNIVIVWYLFQNRQRLFHHHHH